MGRSRRRLSLRARFLLTAFTGAVIPLGAIGLWLSWSAARSGEALVAGRLQDAADDIARSVGAQWVPLRSRVLNAAELPLVRAAAARADSAVLRLDDVPDVRALSADVARMEVRNAAGRVRLTFASRNAGGSADGLVYDVPITVGGVKIGVLRAWIRQTALVGASTPARVPVDGILTVIDRATGVPLQPVLFDPTLMANDRFAWGNESWIARRHRLFDPAVDVVLAAPLGPYVEPFAGAARRGLLALLAAAICAVVIAVVASKRVTASVETLAAATDAVARGDLERRIPLEGSDEVVRVASAFNDMTSNLKRTLGELSRRESLAAVGEFAATVAHEVRNPLTAIRVDLERLSEELPADSNGAPLVARALSEMKRLDATVTSTLQVAKGTARPSQWVDLRQPLRAAMYGASAEFDARGARLLGDPMRTPPVLLRGDANTLQQLFLNLLLNAAQALSPGGEARLSIEVGDSAVTVTLEDTGHGIAAEDLPHVFTPMYSTRAGGTGLGLAVAQRVVEQHEGSIAVESEPGSGTTVRLQFPMVDVGAMQRAVGVV